MSSTSSLFGTQNGLYRLRRFSVSGSLLLNRDTFGASVVNEDRSNITATTFGPNTGSNAFLPILPAGSSSNGTFGTLSWQHELTPVLSSTASVTYGTTEYGNLGGNSARTTTRTVSGLASLNYQITETLSGSARYIYTERTSNTPQTIFGTQGNVTENVVLVGLRKSF